MKNPFDKYYQTNYNSYQLENQKKRIQLYDEYFNSPLWYEKLKCMEEKKIQEQEVKAQEKKIKIDYTEFIEDEEKLKSLRGEVYKMMINVEGGKKWCNVYNEKILMYAENYATLILMYSKLKEIIYSITGKTLEGTFEDYLIE